MNDSWDPLHEFRWHFALCYLQVGRGPIDVGCFSAELKAFAHSQRLWNGWKKVWVAFRTLILLFVWHTGHCGVRLYLGRSFTCDPCVFPRDRKAKLLQMQNDMVGLWAAGRFECWNTLMLNGTAIVGPKKESKWYTTLVKQPGENNIAFFH